MPTHDEEYKLESFSTLNEVILVENTLHKINDSIVTIQQLKESLDNKVNSDTLKIIVDYLEMANRIAVTSKGITWIYNANPRLQKAVAERLEL
jgi:hypothetical protein